MHFRVDGENLLVLDDDNTATWCIPLAAVASWRQLLGLDSDVEAVAAILRARDPGILDTDTGRNAWTSAYEQCERERLIDLAQTGEAALHVALSASGGLVADGRAYTRSQLGLPSGSVMRMRVMSVTGEAPGASIPLPDGLDAEELSGLFSEPTVGARIAAAHEAFEQSLVQIPANDDGGK